MLAKDLKDRQVPIPNLFWVEDEEELLCSNVVTSETGLRLGI